tara:strand:+ start:260 stop:457 length:198 start_codon:yes stop_codon:yes gene_type:complete
MILETVFAVAVNLVSAEVPSGGNLLKSVITYNKVQNMKQDDAWKSSLHEESYQILKDAIREAGKQ